MRKDDLAYALQMVVAVEKITKYCGQVTKREFMKNELIKDAVMRNLSLLVAAADMFPDTLRKRHRTIPWKAVDRLRDLVVYDVGSTDYVLVWESVKKDLPLLRETVLTAMRPFKETSGR